MATTRPLSLPEQVALISTLDRLRDQLLVRFGLQTGFRISELLRLTVADVWQDGGPHTELTISRRNLKGGAGAYCRRVRSRTVPLHPSLRAAVQGYIALRFGTSKPPGDAILFLSREGENRAIGYPQAFRILKRAAVAAGVDPRRLAWHSTRKAFVRAVYDGSGHDLVLTQRIVGHASVLTTSRYLETTEEAARSVVLAIPPPPWEQTEAVRQCTTCAAGSAKTAVA